MFIVIICRLVIIVISSFSLIASVIRSIFISSLDILLLTSKSLYVSSSFVLSLSFYPIVIFCVSASFVFSFIVFLRFQ